MSSSEYQDIFNQLKQILQTHEAKLHVTQDEPEGYSLDSFGTNKGKAIYFGGVQEKKNYVSYHLMPVYIFPELLSEISPALKKRMQGKSCFNFKKADPDLFAELAAFTQKCADRFQAADYLKS